MIITGNKSLQHLLIDDVGHSKEFASTVQVTFT